MTPDSDADDELTEIPGIADEQEAEPMLAPADPWNGLGKGQVEAITVKACRRTENILDDRGQSHSCGMHLSTLGGSWLDLHQRARTAIAGNLRHRRALGGIFADSESGGLSLNSISHIIAVKAAKQASRLVGSDPFIQAMPAKITDKSNEKLVKQCEAKVQEEISRSNFRDAMAGGIETALNLGTQSFMVTWEKDVSQFTDSAEVAVDEAGAPIKTPKGQYIFKKDDLLTMIVMLDEAGAVADGIPPRAAKAGPDGQMEPLQPGEVAQTRLKKEPSYVFNAPPNFQTVPNLLQTVTHMDGLRVSELFVEDHIYPLYVASLDDPACDLQVRRYDGILEDIARRYHNAGYIDERKTLMQSAPISAAGNPLDHSGEEGRGYGGTGAGRNTEVQQTIGIHETFYRTWFVPPGGTEEINGWLYLVIDWTTRRCIYAQQLCRMKMKKPPFFLLRGLKREPCRAYGVGIFARAEHRGNAADFFFNTGIERAARSQKMHFAYKNAVDLGEHQRLEWGSKVIYPLNNTGDFSSANPPVLTVSKDEALDKEFELMQVCINSLEKEYGVVDPQANNSNSARGEQVATAIRNIENTGNSLNESSEALQAYDIQRGAEIAVEAILSNMDPEEMIWVPGEETLATINREEIQNLPREIKLLVTRARASDSIELATAAADTIEAYLMKPAWLQKAVRDSTIDKLKALFVADADDRCPEPSDEEVAASRQAPAPEPPSETMNIRLDDVGPLTPDERAQVLEKFGVRASPPEEVMAMEMQAKAQEMEQAKLKMMKPPGTSGENPSKQPPQQQAA